MGETKPFVKSSFLPAQPRARAPYLHRYGRDAKEDCLNDAE